MSNEPTTSLTALHRDIMNLPDGIEPGAEIVNDKFLSGFRMGHRDARHAAAELVSAALSAAAPAATPALQQAVLRWWESMRPLSYTEEQHRANPTVNTQTDSEGQLALAVVAALSGSAPAPSVRTDALLQLLAVCEEIMGEPDRTLQQRPERRVKFMEAVNAARDAALSTGAAPAPQQPEPCEDERDCTMHPWCKDKCLKVHPAAPGGQVPSAAIVEAPLGSAPSAEGSAPELAYSTDEENFNFDSVEEAVESMDDPQPGDIVYEGEVVKRAASHYWHKRRGLEWLLENLNEQAYDEAGEFAEDWPGNSITDEGEKALEVGIRALLDQHIGVSFYTVANVRRIALTAKMIAEFLPEPKAQGPLASSVPTMAAEGTPASSEPDGKETT